MAGHGRDHVLAIQEKNSGEDVCILLILKIIFLFLESVTTQFPPSLSSRHTCSMHTQSWETNCHLIAGVTGSSCHASSTAARADAGVLSSVPAASVHQGRVQ